MSNNEQKPKSTGRKRKEHYDEKLKIKGTLFDVLKVAMKDMPDENKEKDQEQNEKQEQE